MHCLALQFLTGPFDEFDVSCLPPIVLDREAIDGLAFKIAEWLHMVAIVLDPPAKEVVNVLDLLFGFQGTSPAHDGPAIGLDKAIGGDADASAGRRPEISLQFEH